MAGGGLIYYFCQPETAAKADPAGRVAPQPKPSVDDPKHPVKPIVGGPKLPVPEPPVVPTPDERAHAQRVIARKFREGRQSAPGAKPEPSPKNPGGSVFEAPAFLKWIGKKASGARARVGEARRKVGAKAQATVKKVGDKARAMNDGANKL